METTVIVSEELIDKRKAAKLKQEAENKKEAEKLKKNIVKHQKSIWCPKNIQLTNIKTNSCCDIQTYAKSKKDTNNMKLKTKSDIAYKCHKIKIYPTYLQRLILNNWFNAYIDMYNETLYYIKKNKDEAGFDYDWMKAKGGDLNTKIQELISNSTTYIGRVPKAVKGSEIKYNIIVLAIELVFSNYKSAFTNYKRGYINKFRIRYWRKDRPIKTMDIVKTLFSKIKEVFCSTIFTQFDIEHVMIKDCEELGKSELFKLSDVQKKEKFQCDCKLQYEKETDTYTLLVPEKIKPTPKTTKIVKDNICSLDPGIRTFMNGLSENQVIKIGTDIPTKIRIKLKKLDNIQKNKKIPKKIKKKHEKSTNKKIKHMVDELHWKSARYLTSNYKNILIGDMSIKSVVSGDSKLQKIIKRVGLRLRFYQFKQRLKYKCGINCVGYREVNERYTTKTCSVCSVEKHDVGAAKIFKCSSCSASIDRDVNGSRNIYFKCC